ASFVDLVVTSFLLTHTTLLFFFNYTATTELYTLSLHDALPILDGKGVVQSVHVGFDPRSSVPLNTSLAKEIDTLLAGKSLLAPRSEEHTSELQSLTNLVCRLLLEKKK